MEHLPELSDDVTAEELLRITLMEKSKALILKPESWTTGALARSFWKKKVVHYSSDEADQWCALGAIRKVVYDSLGTNLHSICVCTEIIKSMENAIGTNLPMSLSRYNDLDSVSHDRVLSLFDRAIANEKECLPSEMFRKPFRTDIPISVGEEGSV